MTTSRTAGRVSSAARLGSAVAARVGSAWAALLLLAAATPLDAQILRVPTSDRVSVPITVHAAAGYFLTQNRFDGQTGLPWYLGDGWQYRIGADVGWDVGTLGVAATFATVPIQRGNSAASVGDIQQRQFLATFRSGESEGFGQLIELGAGLSQWVNYSGTDVLTREEAKPRNALALVLGYGFSLPLGKRARLTLVQDYATVVGSGEGLPAGARRAQEQYTTRLGLRWRASGERR